tara:strand:- start:88 stop:618 length:531 start_codon:yes stop_codon:yes gene_type:complete
MAIMDAEPVHRHAIDACAAELAEILSQRALSGHSELENEHYADIRQSAFVSTIEEMVIERNEAWRRLSDFLRAEMIRQRPCFARATVDYQRILEADVELFRQAALDMCPIEAGNFFDLLDPAGLSMELGGTLFALAQNCALSDVLGQMDFGDAMHLADDCTQYHARLRYEDEAGHD